jgi:hypothetical protein
MTVVIMGGSDSHRGTLGGGKEMNLGSFRHVSVTASAILIVAAFCGSALAMTLNVAAVPADDSYVPMQSTTGPESTYSNAESGLMPAEEVVISGVPAYEWYHGCGPTAVGMVVGYWDGLGFDDLVPGDASVQTEYVDAMIASPSHIADYAFPMDNYYTGLLPDKSTLGGAHASDCVADFMHTSWSSDGNMWGWTWSDMIDDGFSDYVSHVNPSYSVATTLLAGNSLTWEWYVHEIDSGHPAVFLVDSNGDAYTDHFVTAIGYCAVGKAQFYACYDTWDYSVSWFEFARMAKGQWFGIYCASCFELTMNEAYSASKTWGEGATSASWTETPASTSSFSVSLDNNGFKSVVVEIFDVTSGKSVKVMHDTVIMRSQNAYPFGLASTDSVTLEQSHTYSIWIGSLDGPIGSYLVAYPGFA